MHSYNDAFYQLKNKLQSLYDHREAAAIAHEIMHHITALDKVARLLNKETLLTAQQQKQYDQATTELLNGRPLQYVTGVAWFLGKEFTVNESVLIPRPETEELVQWIIKDHNSQFLIPNSQFHILDIGTGSGCIPVSLKLAMPEANITTCDISGEALAVAEKNAAQSGVDIQLLQLDFLDQAGRDKLGIYDVIVSNPPYIPVTEKDNMHTNVKDHEPGIALFVPEDDPLLFYKAIAAFGKQHLNGNGTIYCELEVNHVMACKTLFETYGYKNVEIRKDIHGNWRMLKAENR